jgi:DNA-binding transcriptional LysR family regulator
MHLSVFCGLSPAHADSLQRRAVDLIVTSNPIYDVDGLERHMILREPFILLTPAAIAQEASRLSLDEIAARHPLIRYSARSAQGAQVERHLRRLGVRSPTTVEIDASDALVAMVAAGCGWAITTPLCYLQGRAHAVATVPARLPGLGFSRDIMLIAHEGDYAELPQKVSQQARRLLTQVALPEIKRLIPWLKDEMIVGPLSVNVDADA